MKQRANLVKIAVLENELLDLAEQQAICEHDLIEGTITNTGYDQVWQVCTKCSKVKGTMGVQRCW